MSIFTNDPLQIISFQSFGTSNELYLRGRALEDENINLEKKGFFSLLKNTWKRFETDEIRYERLKITLPNDQVVYSETDGEGYYLLDQTSEGLNQMTNDEGWLHYEISYEKNKRKRHINNNNRFPGEMLIPSEKAKFGIISDIDDTILNTGVVSKLKWRVLVNSLLKHVENRTAFKGVSELYQKLHRGQTGKEANPLFYVSNSPWNLYRYLEYFVAHNNFPKGPILLRDFSTPFEKKSANYESHKEHEIKNILKTYPKMKFILIGDAGEHDTDIYMDIVKKFPNRILAIYIRAVNHSKRMHRVKSLVENYEQVPVVFFEKSAEIEAHTKSLNLI